MDRAALTDWTDQTAEDADFGRLDGDDIDLMDEADDDDWACIEDDA